MTCFEKKGLEIKRSTCCLSSYIADIAVSYPEVVPQGRLSHLFIKIKWQKPDNDQESIIKLESIAGGGVVLFNGAGGTAVRKFSGSVAQPLAVFGKTASAGGKADVNLVVEIREKPRVTLALKVGAAYSPAEQEALKALQDELMVAAAATRPADPAGKIWDYYDRLFKDAAAIAVALTPPNVPGDASVPTVGGAPENRAIPLQELITHLQPGRDANGPAARKARMRRFAFDLFEGKWRGHSRERQTCGAIQGDPNYQNICQDQDRRQTVPVAAGSTVQAQPLVMGPDSREYAEGASKTCLDQPPGGRDYNDYGVNLIDTATGLIFGATGLRENPGPDGVRAARPRVGFYVDYNKLIWLEEQQRDQDQATYRIFCEISEFIPASGDPIYTLLGFDFNWKSGHIEGDLPTQAGQFRKYLAEDELALERQFNLRHLSAEHLAPPRGYRRRLESMSTAEIQAFLDNTALGPLHDYLEKVQGFVRQRKALEDAKPGVRQKITFLTGRTDDAYFAAAASYFDLNPSGATIPWRDAANGNISSLSDIKNYLRDHVPAGVPWGQVNIVAHANPSGRMVVPLFNGDSVTDLVFLTLAIHDGRFLPLPDDQLDCRSEIYIRGCEIGENRVFLGELSRGFAGTNIDDLQRPTVWAPKVIQTYYRHQTQFPDGARLDGAEEGFAQKWFVIQPDDLPFNAHAIAAVFKAKYDATFPNIDWEGALGRAAARYNGDFYPDPLDGVFTFQLRLANPAAVPPLGTPAQQRTVLEGTASLIAWLTGLGLTIDHFRWTFELQGSTLNMNGNCMNYSVERAVLADHQDLFTIGLDRLGDLNSHLLSPELLKAFADAGHALSEEAEVLILWKKFHWLIKDRVNRKTYILIKSPANLAVRLETPRAVIGVTIPGDAAQITAHKDSVARSLPTELFHTGTAPVSDLDRSFVSAGLVGTFSSRGFPFNAQSGDVTVIVIDAGRAWHIFDNDNGRQFVILRDGGNLRFYLQPFRAHPCETVEEFVGHISPIIPNPKPPGENVPFP